MGRGAVIMSDEQKLHESIEKYRGGWEIKTKWGYIKVELLPKRIGFGSKKGTPDEILITKITLPILGKTVNIQVPILLEAETKGGLNGALSDLSKFSERNLKEGEDSYIEIPMLVIGKRHHTKKEEIQLRCTVNIEEREGGM